ncbi:MAG TPA: Hpt domain-containing protein, partial [Candidatus Limnocylindria bacterium]|nr:Hpt domain-containing protein [Candidatus Limnocylindria bacterium]
AEALVRPAHTLKSSSATLGAMRLSALARELEMAGRSGSLAADAGELLQAAVDTWAATSEGLEVWFSGHDA